MNMRVDIDNTELLLLATVTLVPHRLMHPVGYLVERLDVGVLKASQEVASRTRVWNALGPQHVPHGLAVLKFGDVLDTLATYKQIVDVPEHVVGLVKRPMPAQQAKLGVDRLRQPKLLDHSAGQRQTAVGAHIRGSAKLSF